MENNISEYLWDTTLFIKDNMDFNDKWNLSVIDRWIAGKCHIIINLYLKYLQVNDFDNAKDVVDKFFINDYCMVYLPYIKSKIEKDGSANKKVLLSVFIEILKMYLMFIPDVVKFIYFNLFKNANTNLLYNDNLKTIKYNEIDLSFGEDIRNVILNMKEYCLLNNISEDDSLEHASITIKKIIIKIL